MAHVHRAKDDLKKSKYRGVKFYGEPASRDLAKKVKSLQRAYKNARSAYEKLTGGKFKEIESTFPFDRFTRRPQPNDSAPEPPGTGPSAPTPKARDTSSQQKASSETFADAFAHAHARRHERPSRLSRDFDEALAGARPRAGFSREFDEAFAPLRPRDHEPPLPRRKMPPEGDTRRGEGRPTPRRENVRTPSSEESASRPTNRDAESRSRQEGRSMAPIATNLRRLFEGESYETHEAAVRDSDAAELDRLRPRIQDGSEVAGPAHEVLSAAVSTGQAFSVAQRKVHRDKNMSKVETSSYLAQLDPSARETAVEEHLRKLDALSEILTHPWRSHHPNR